MDIGRLQQENRSLEITDIYSQRLKRSGLKMSGPPPERRSTISSVMPCSYQNALRLRNLSGGSTTSGSSTNSTLLDNQYFTTDNSGSNVQVNRSNSSPACHKKLDRSWSDSDNDRNTLHRSVNSSRYKTELCRPFEESGSCKYGDKCQFAHGYHELRNLARHPKYKTELCRTFHTVGFCPYGPRCHFIHEEETKPESSPKVARSGSVQSSGSSSPTLSPPSSDDVSIFNYQNDPLSLSSPGNSQFSSPLSVNINNCSSNYVNNFDQALKQLSLQNLNKNCSDVFIDKGPKMIGSEERDIFSEVTMFSVDELLLDNAPKQPVRLDNFPPVDNFSAVRDASYWNKENISQLMRPLDPFHHSPTGSDGCSSGSSSDCGGSTESLSSSGFTEWRSALAVGQY